jgi:hypothetical protein
LRHTTSSTAPRLRILEINPAHPLIRSMASALKVKGDSEPVTEAALLLLDQARILDGEVPPDPADLPAACRARSNAGSAKRRNLLQPKRKRRNARRSSEVHPASSPRGSLRALNPERPRVRSFEARALILERPRVLSFEARASPSHLRMM